MLYFLICLTISTIVTLLLTLLTFIPPIAFVAFTDSPEARTIVIGILAAFVGFLALFPILSVIFFLVFALIQHGLLRLLAGRDQRGLLATLRVLCYSTGACTAVSWIPLLNLLIGFYYFYQCATGLKRVHGISPLRALMAVLIIPALWLVLAAFGILYAFNFVQEVTKTPVSYYFPQPEVSEEPPPGAVSSTALMDGSKDQAQIRQLRDASYSDAPTPDSYHTELSVATADQRGSQRGIRGFAREAGGGVVRIDPDDPKESTPDTQNILYYTSEGRSSSPEGYYDTPIVQRVLFQRFMLRGGARYTVEFEQVGEEPRIITVGLFSDPDTQRGEAYFHVPYRGSDPGDEFKIELSSGTPLDELRLQVDRDGVGAYEQSWMPEASILGGAVEDGTSPVTEATLKEDPQREGPLLVLNATDRGSPDEGIPPSGVGITYYWVNDSGVRIYTDPVPVEAGDEVTYWSIDRSANSEWRRTVDVGVR